MNQKLVRLFTLEPNLYCQDSPVLVTAGALMDGPSGTYAQLKLFALEALEGCTLEVDAYDRFGLPLSNATMRYDAAAAGTYFGDRTAVYLPDAGTVSIQVRVTEVTLAGGVTRTLQGEWAPLPQCQHISQVLPDPALQSQYALEAGEKADYWPLLHRGLLLCTCGSITSGNGHVCRSCGRSWERLQTLADPARLAANARERLLREEEERLAAEAEVLAREAQLQQQAAARRKKKTKTLLILIPTLVLLAALAIAIPTVILPELRRSQAYTAAQTLLEEEAFDEANAAFLALADYKDASQLAQEALYRKAEQLAGQEQFAQAIDLFTALGVYRDSDERAEETRIAWKEKDYAAAQALQDAGEYVAAAQAFAALEDFRDAAAKQEESLELDRLARYDAALRLMENGGYEEAVALFTELKGYKDSTQRISDTYWLWAQEADAADQLAQALSLYRKAGTREGSDQAIQDLSYRYGRALLEAEEYETAIPLLTACSGYQNADKLLMDAKFGYCSTHADNKNQTTYQYIKELKAAYYKGASALFDELYAWKVSVIAFNNDLFSKVDMAQISKYKNMYVHFKVTGGEPGETCKLWISLTAPTGESGSLYYEDVKDGDELSCNYYYFNPSQAPGGTLTFRAYDPDNRSRVICTDSVLVGD